MAHPVNKGDKISVYGMTVTIEEVIHAEWWDRFGYAVEFIDTTGKYRYWKQWDDGGKLIKSESKPDSEKLLEELRQIFKKYGYDL